MSLRTPSPSMFRPKGGIDQSPLTENRKLLEEIDRRKILRGAVSLGALTMLTGLQRHRQRRGAGGAEGRLPFQRRRAGADLPAQPSGADLHRGRSREAAALQRLLRHRGRQAGRRQDMEARARRPDRQQASRGRRARSTACPSRKWIIRHICVEGWDYIGQWSGVNLRQFLERIGADLTAKYVAFRCADDYTGSIDMATALHPQTILATKYGRRADRRSVRLSAAAAHRDQARLQEPEMDHRRSR